MAFNPVDLALAQQRAVGYEERAKERERSTAVTQSRLRTQVERVQEQIARLTFRGRPLD